VRNSGAAFGFAPAGATLFLVASVVVWIGLVAYVARNPIGEWSGVVLGLILGGTMGNGYDRIVPGTVTDFINFHFWPVFNVADAAISNRAALMIAGYLPRRNPAGHRLRGRRHRGHQQACRHGRPPGAWALHRNPRPCPARPRWRLVRGRRRGAAGRGAPPRQGHVGPDRGRPERCEPPSSVRAAQGPLAEPDVPRHRPGPDHGRRRRAGRPHRPAPARAQTHGGGRGRPLRADAVPGRRTESNPYAFAV